jgi:CDGSH-type Zn-finger protein
LTETRVGQAIEVTENGPYHVTGGVPLRRVRKIPGDRGSFTEWEPYEEIEAPDEYWLCRCGQSTTKPFCSGMHEKVGFDGTEVAPTNTYRERAEVLGGTKLTVRDDRGICAHAAYCSNAMTNVWKAAKLTDDDAEMTQTVIAMIERCPSGALTMERDGVALEPALEPEIWVQSNGPYVIRGGIPITRSDGQPIESRNRMCVCRCGQSSNKPLCDGTHDKVGFQDA